MIHLMYSNPEKGKDRLSSKGRKLKTLPNLKIF